jgi:hypothetical protein
LVVQESDADWLFRNQMLWDFGLNPLHMDNPAAVEGKIREIEDTFHLGKPFVSSFFTMQL